MESSRAHQDFLHTRVFPGLDGLRCLSIVLVVAHHVSGASSGFLGRGGYLGVSLFFAISGFLITSLLLRERDAHGQISLGRFYGRRALRIFPLYYAVLGAYVVLTLLLEKGPEKAAFFENLPSFLTYTSNWFVRQEPGQRAIFYFAWSLATEEQFYLLWPGVMFLAHRWGAVLFMWGLLFVSLWVPWAVGEGLLNDSLLSVRILASFAPPICMGCLAAYAVHSPRGYVWMYRVLGPSWVAPALMGLVLLAVGMDGTPFWLTSTLMTALVVSSCLRADHRLMPLLTFRPFRYIGMISYGVYLMHMLAFGMVRKVFPGQVFGVSFVLTLALAVLMAGLSYRYFESYFLRLKARLAVAPAPAAPARASSISGVRSSST